VTRAEMEARRLSALPDLQSSISSTILSERYGVSRMTIGRWRAALRSGVSLKLRRSAGRPCRMTPEQELKIQSLAEGSVLTTAQWAKMIWYHTRIRYSSDHVGRILHRLGIPVGPRGRSVPKPRKKRAAGGPAAS
jgi:putative transposase